MPPYNSVIGRRLLLNQLDAYKRQENNLQMRRRDAMSRLGLDRQGKAEDRESLLGYDEQLTAVVRHRTELEQEICECRVAPEPRDTDRVQVGLVVIARNDAAKKPADKVLVRFIGGRGEDFADHEPPIVPYHSAIGKAFMRKHEGDIVELPTGEFRIEEILFLHDYLKSLQRKEKKSA